MTDATPQPVADASTRAAHVAVIVCGYNSAAYIEDCFTSLLASVDEGVRTTAVFVDDASTDGSADLIRQRFPQVEVVRQEPNVGFAGANNAGWAHVRKHHPGVRYVALLNVDTIVESGWLAAMVRVLEQHPEAGAVQSKLRLHPDTRRINTAGNRNHFLGFGYMTGYQEVDRGQFDAVRPIDFASGAAVMVRRELLDELGLFDATMYMTMEDTELSWKLRCTGHEALLAPASVVYHKYHVSAPFKYYYSLERNRLLLVWTYYRAATLLLILPALLFMEAGQVLFALMHGRLRDKLRGWAWFLAPGRWPMLWRRRRDAQRRRTVRDRDFVGRFAGTIRFGPIDHPLLVYVANPLLAAYWWAVRRVMWW